MTLVYNSPDPKHHWTEGGINVNHDGFDDLNYMGFGLKSKENHMRAFGVWLWKKDDFLNGGDKYPVSFDENSRIAVYISRTYPVDKFNDTYALKQIDVVPRELWRGWEDVEFVVQDAGQFYVAQTDLRPKQQTLFEIFPAKVKWAKWNPVGPWDFEWDRKTANFEEHKFTDVRAAGWMVAKPTREIATFWLKWYAFGMDAVVNRPWSPGWNLPLEKFGGGDGRDGLYITKENVSYEQSIKIYKWANRNQYCLHHGYNFCQDANPGGVMADSKDCFTTDTATGMTWQDAVLWCNALSEYEGKTPCYYEDTKFAKALRSVKDRSCVENSMKIPAIYLKSDSDGYRLPTAEEFSSSKAGSTNFWSFIWDADGPVFDLEKQKTHTVLGGSANFARLPAGEIPSRGHHAIGFRPVRREGPSKSIEFSKLPEKSGISKFKNLNAWTFTEEEKVRTGKTMDTTPLVPNIEMTTVDNILAGRTEISYAQWKTVYNWAELNGYRFDHDGDAGSLKWDNQTTPHSQDEPVTSISALDAIVWCNALSEMKGAKPCYYEDAELVRLIKVVPPHRVMALANRQTIYYAKPRLDGIMAKLFFVDEKADGYRLPTNDEWTLLAGAMPGGKGHPSNVASEGFPSGKTLDPETAWYRENSGERTHPVGKTKATGAGFHDLSGNVFEWVLQAQQKGGWLAECRGGSHRCENISSTTPALNNKFAARYNIGGGLSVGLANDEIGFRVVRNK